MCTANIILTCPLHTVAGDAEAARHIAGEYVRKSFKFNNLENTTSGKTPVLMEQRYRQDSGKGKNEKNSFRRQHWGVRQECLFITGQSGETCEGLPFAPQFRTETVYDLSIRGYHQIEL